MGKFDRAGAGKRFDEIGKKDAEKASVIMLQNISTEDLLDNPENGEDVDFTEDLEKSMEENGFTDPIEVTDFGQEEGKYMILSGHRRRSAAVKVGITMFPCLVRHFKDRLEVKNYMLSSNAQRDSARDPFLMSKRYKMHEQYLLEAGFKGSVRDEVAKRLGISTQQADRYNSMNKVILPIWDMVRAETIGMSSVQPMASHSEEEQAEILEIIREAEGEGVNLTREVMRELVDGYRKGMRTWAEVNGMSAGRGDAGWERDEERERAGTDEEGFSGGNAWEVPIKQEKEVVKEEGDGEPGLVTPGEEPGGGWDPGSEGALGARVRDDPEPGSESKEEGWEGLDELDKVQCLLDSWRKDLEFTQNGGWDGNVDPRDHFEGRLIVSLLESHLRSLEVSVSKQPDLPYLKNDDQRKEWISRYEEWGLWYQDEHLGINYYKYDFDDGTRLVVEAYPKGFYNNYPFLHLIGGPKPPKGAKWPWRQDYEKHGNCTTEVVEFLKYLQRKRP